MSSGWLIHVREWTGVLPESQVLLPILTWWVNAGLVLLLTPVPPHRRPPTARIAN